MGNIKRFLSLIEEHAGSLCDDHGDLVLRCLFFYRLFQQLLKGQFAIYITHRLGAARMADEILVLQDGGVSERGSHDSLCKARGTYYTMYEEQKSWYEK